MPDDGSDPSRLAELLQEAFRRVRDSSLSDAEKSRLNRRLLGVTRTAKHDVGLAARRLKTLVSQLPSTVDRPRDGPNGGADDGFEGRSTRE